MNTVTIYYQQCDGFGWHWELDQGGVLVSSTETFANAWEAERVAKSAAKSNDATYQGARSDADVKQIILENPREVRGIEEPERQDRGTNWAYNGSYQADLERGRLW